MAELTNTDALHQENESTEEMQPRRSCRPGPVAGFPVERRGPLLGRAGDCSVACKRHFRQHQPLRTQPA